MSRKDLRPDFKKLATTPRPFQQPGSIVLGQVPTIAITPVSDGRRGAYEDNQERTWRMVEKVYDLHDEVSQCAAAEQVDDELVGAHAAPPFPRRTSSCNGRASHSWLPG